MSQVRIAAEARTEFGKGAARRARRAGLIPAVLYGHGADPRHINLPAREFARALKSGGSNAVFTVAVDGTDVTALPKVVVKHPLRDYIEHVDLLLVSRGEKVTVDVPVVLVGSAVSGTLIITDSTSVSVEVEAMHIPENVEISLEGLEPGTQITAGDLKLPAGVTLAADPASLIVSVTEAPTAADMDTTRTPASAVGEPGELDEV